MNKIKKVVGASVMGAMLLAPVGTVCATMTAPNVENFYNMPFMVTRINYKGGYFSVIFRKKASYVNIVALTPDVTEEYADEHYESLGTQDATWGKKILGADLSGFPLNMEMYVMTESNFRFGDDVGIFYYAVTFVDGSYYAGKISYEPCKSAFDSGAYDTSDYECRIYYNEGKAPLTAGANGDYMSSYTAARYTGGNEVLTWYAYRPELKSTALTGLPADVKSVEQMWEETEAANEAARLEAERLEAERQELLRQAEAENLAEIERLQNELNTQNDTNAAEIRELQNELDELNAKGEADAAELARLTTELEELNADLAETETKLSELRAELIEKEGILNSLRAEIAEKKATWQGLIEQKEAEITALKTQLNDLEREKSAEIASLKTSIATLESAIAQLKAEAEAEKEAIKSAAEEALTAKNKELEDLAQRLSGTEALREEDKLAFEAKLAELKAKIQKDAALIEALTQREPEVQTQTVYVDREVVKEVEVEKECEVAVAGTEEETTTDTGDDSANLEETATSTPELNKKSSDKAWWMLLPIGAAVCGLAYWWLAPAEAKPKKKK